ncbi:zeta toxin family protein [Pseudomonas viridiflava]|nr:zeta toxin family protein [Pseudomonas viridiflava]MBI6726381.1 zeta toxin family protein [Pseudomonas viridiflava]
MPMPRLRIFAGPMAQGKAQSRIQIAPNLIATYVNADDIEKSVKATGFLDLTTFNLCTTAAKLHEFLDTHPLIEKAGLQEQVKTISLEGQRIDFRAVNMNSYYSSVISDFIRHKLLDRMESFTFETVMSSPDKVSFMKLAQQRGYRTYLYFVATESVEININRVANRVDDGGHPVPEDKIRQRYKRSLELLPSAVSTSNRAYIFDNSGEKSVCLAEITEGTDLQYRVEDMPDWFMEQYVDKVIGANG